MPILPPLDPPLAAPPLRQDVWLRTAVTRKVVNRFTYFLNEKIRDSILGRYPKFHVNVLIASWVIGEKQERWAKFAPPSTARVKVSRKMFSKIKTSHGAHLPFLQIEAVLVWVPDRPKQALHVWQKKKIALIMSFDLEDFDLMFEQNCNRILLRKK